MDKADFYVGEDNIFLRWIGSVQNFGSPYDLPTYLLGVKDPHEFERITQYYLCEVAIDGVTPKNGWPHLWKDSRMTTYSYIFIDKKVYCSMFGGYIFDPIVVRRGEDMFEAIKGVPPTKPLFPNMLIHEAAKILMENYTNG